MDHKGSWAAKNWCFWTVVLNKTLENPLDSKEIQLVHPEGDQSCVFIGRTDAKAEAPILWPPDMRDWLTEKMLWKIEGRRRGQPRTRWLDGIQRTWIWMGSRCWWWAGKPGMLQPMGLQRVSRDWGTELNWIS